MLPIALLIPCKSIASGAKKFTGLVGLWPYLSIDRQKRSGMPSHVIVCATCNEAWERRIEVEGFPVCHIDDIIASKKAANRKKDRESLERLQSFRDYWKSKRPKG